MQRRLAQTLTDIDTGEVVEGYDLVAMPRKRAKFTQEFVQMFQEGLRDLAMEGELSKTEMRVLWYLIGRLDYENFINVPQVEIAEKLKLHRPDVSAAMKTLAAQRIIVRGPKTGRTSTWQLAQHYGWKGNVTKYNKRRLSLVKSAPDDAGMPAKLRDQVERQRTQLELLEERVTDERNDG